MKAGIVGATKYRDQVEIDEFVSGEAKARRLLLPHYPSFGLTIVNTNGNKGRDIVGIGKSGKSYKIEEKYRDGDFGDFLIEILQDMVPPIDLGWFYKTEADLLSYVICDHEWIPNKIYIIRWQEMKAWLLKNLGFVPSSSVISGRGIGLTLNLAIRWECLPEELIRIHDLEKEG